MLHGDERLTGVLLCGYSTEQYTSKTRAEIGSRYILNTNAIGVIHLKPLGGMQVLHIEHGAGEDTSYFLGVDVLTVAKLVWSILCWVPMR